MVKYALEIPSCLWGHNTYTCIGKHVLVITWYITSLFECYILTFKNIAYTVFFYHHIPAE